jgi:hypothetical protein
MTIPKLFTYPCLIKKWIKEANNEVDYNMYIKFSIGQLLW